jgi:hypothetical protein
MKSHRVVLLFKLLLCGFFSLSYAESNWQLRSHKKGLQFYSKQVAGSSIMAAKGVFVVNAPISVVAQVLADAEHYHLWSYQAKVAQVLERKDPYTATVFLVLGSPVPLVQDRELIYEIFFEQASEHSYQVIYRLRPDLLPLHPKRVRVQVMETSWLLMPDSTHKNQTRIVFQTHSDPGGSIPNWLINWGLEQILHKSLSSFVGYVEAVTLQLQQIEAVKLVNKAE